MTSQLISDSQLKLNIGEAGKEVLPYGDVVGEQGGGVAVANIFSSLLSVASLVAGLILLFNLIIAAFEWMNSAGDSGKLEKARNRITQSIIGILVLAAVLAIFILVQAVLEVELINFSFVGGQPDVVPTPTMTQLWPPGSVE